MIDYLDRPKLLLKLMKASLKVNNRRANALKVAGRLPRITVKNNQIIIEELLE